MPTVNEEIAALKVFAKGGVYVEPTDVPVPPVPPVPPAPTPTPPPVTPIPTPATGLYAEIGGIPAGASMAHPGEDLSKLAGDWLLPAGDYVASGDLHDGVGLYATAPGTVRVVGKGGQVKAGKGVKLAGLTFTGFGLAKDTDGTHAGIVTDDGCQLHSVEVTKSVGVGILFKGSGLKSYDLHAHHNGTSGRMIRSRGDNQTKGSGFHEVRSHLHDNNHGGKKSDAANKATQTSDHLGEDLHIHDEDDGAVWYDIACWNCVLVRPNIHDIKTSVPNQRYRGVGVRFELNEYGTYPSGVYQGRFANIDGSVLAVNESSNIDFVGNTVGKCDLSIELRQMTRDDDPGDGGTDPSKWSGKKGPGRPGGTRLGWVTYRLHVADNTFASNAGPMAMSGAGNDTAAPHTKDIRLGANAITLTNNTGLAVKVQA